MKYFSAQDIQDLDRLFRTNLINSITGYKSANLLGSCSSDGRTNLAIFSSAVHIGANPALIGIIMRPLTVPRHSYQNIQQTGVYTLNHVNVASIRKAHYTSAKFAENKSEFEACGFTARYTEGFAAPFVAESRLQIGLELVEEIPIKSNGTLLLIGQVKHLRLPEEIIKENGQLALDSLQTACISGLNTYYEATELATFPYARVEEFNQSLSRP